jgi:hypothetical protein
MFLKKASFLIFSFLTLAHVQADTVRTPLVEMKISGGYCRGICPTTKIKIFNDGIVNAIYIKNNRSFSNLNLPTMVGNNTEVFNLVTLSKEVLNQLEKEINEIRKEEALFDTNPNGPRCTDTPKVEFSIFRRDELNSNLRKKIVIGKRQFCKSFVRNDYKGEKITTLVKAFMDVYSTIK